MMKTAVMFLIALALVSPMAIADPQGQNAGGQQVQTTQEVGTQQQTQNQGEDQNLTVQNQERERERARNVTELHQMIQERKMEMNQSLQNMSNIQQHIYMNQNTVREAVHAFLAMENLTGGIGPNVSQIAREFNNSVQATIMAEEKIQTRSQFARFFVGGDKDAAGELENETNRNQERIQ